MRERKNVYELPPGDTTLEWYAKAVANMKSRPTTDPTSWNYQGAIHGFNAGNPFWAGAPPLPPESEQLEFWKRCQHSTWFFLPWHRMYLAYFEQIVLSVVVELGGPADWALPFWNYSDTTNPHALDIPPAFTDPQDGSNPLWIPGRVNNALTPYDVGLGSLNIVPFVGSIPQGFGGRETAFNHGGGPFGGLEQTPHNLVHVRIGGAMGNPQTAALDPIFWLHHANIDRLWQVWINMGGGRTNPSQASWLNYRFRFHDADRNKVSMSCEEVLDTRTILGGYTYQGVPAQAPQPMLMRAAAPAEAAMPLEVVAADNEVKPLGDGVTDLSLNLGSAQEKQKANLRTMARAVQVPQSAYLLFENITGKGVPPVYNVYLNLPNEKEMDEEYLAGSMGFFGIEEASTPGTHSDGSGIQYVLDVGPLLNKLRSQSNWDESKLSVRLMATGAMPEDASVSVGRISLYSE